MDAAIRRELGPLYDELAPGEREQHRELLERINRPDDAALEWTHQGSGRWKITIAAGDSIGVLSMIAGLMTAHRIEVWRGDLFSLSLSPSGDRPKATGPARGRWPFRRPRRSAGVSRKILDIFEAVAPHIEGDAFWNTFREELAGLIGLVVRGQLDKAREEIADRVSTTLRRMPPTDERLLPVSISFDNKCAPGLTGLHILSPDTPGFLFALSNALTMLQTNIARVQIRTVGDEVRDTFWITDSHGRKIVAEQKLHQLRLAAVLIKQFTHLLPSAPNPSQALRQFGAMVSDLVDDPALAADFDRLQSTPVLRTFAEMMGVSRFLWEDFLRMQHENLFPVVSDTSTLEQSRDKHDLERRLRDALKHANDDEQRSAVVNRFKDREMLRMDLRHITRRTGDVAFAGELSDLAEVVVAESVRLSHARLTPKYGVPHCEDGEACPLAVLALGKFGGREMGFASDIELMFVYQQQGTTDGPQQVDNAQYFDELVQTFLRALQARQEGIFQIDLRLRPFGKGGRLASSRDDFKSYYRPEGPAQQFERMALVKLRPVAGDGDLGASVLRARDRFVYSGQPLDRSRIRHLRSRQASELVREGTFNAKYSPGGLVDLEYFVQMRQIECGASDRELRVTNTMEALTRLEKAGHVDPALAAAIRKAYGCLRRVIDALRAVRGNAKDLTVPEADSREFRYLARRVGYESVEPLREELKQSMAVGRRLWEPTASAEKS